MSTVRISPVKRELTERDREGTLYCSRANGRDFYFGWDDNDKNRKSQSVTLSLPPGQAIELAIWLVRNMTPYEREVFQGIVP